jgi:hypothetical protein
MDSHLAMTGTTPLLEELSPFVPDAFINELCRWQRPSGPRPLYGPAQLFRVHLLALLTSAHSFNLLVELLKENRSWRRCALLSHRHRVPDAKMLHQFRDQLGVGGLRAINTHLLLRLLESCRPDRKTVAIIDSTDLPAATNAYKKTGRGLHSQRCRARRTYPQARTQPLVCRL